jgi:hypothetical protein
MKAEKHHNETKPSPKVSPFYKNNIPSAEYPHLKLVKPAAVAIKKLPLSVEHIIGEDVEHFKNLEDFLSYDGDDDEMIELLTH